MQTATPPLLKIADLSFTYLGQPEPTLQNVNLTLQPGELVVLAGETGSGKSTLLNCLTGISPDNTGGKLSGQVFLKNEEMTGLSIRDRSQFMGIMLQNVETQLFTDEVWEEVVFGLENWNLPPEQIHHLAQAAIAEFQLSAQQHWSIQQLSAGQKQRLLLACLLTRQPELLVLDEPFAFLDQAGVEQLLALLEQRVQQGQTVLVIEHRLELLKDLCDRAYWIEAGQVSPAELSQIHQRSQAYSTEASGSHAPRPSFSTTHLTETSVVLRTKNISWGGYPAFPDLQVRAGETVLLQAGNGRGKTTLLRLLSGLLKPTTGFIELLGEEVTRRSVVQISQTIGFVLQNPNHQLFSESVAAAVKQTGVTADKAQQLLEALNLSHCVEQHPHALSQGQKRRLALGAVLARQPKICLLDEIMVGQDPTSLGLMLGVLQSFTQAGGTLIFTSHDPGVTALLRPRCVILN